MSRTLTSRSSLTRTRASSNTREGIETTQRHRPVASNRGRGSSTGAARARGRRMNYQGEGYGYNIPRNNTAGQFNENRMAEEPLTTQTQGGQYTSGYTMFPPNQQKREQISQMAQKETMDYQQYRQVNALRHISQTGRVGGGNLTENEVRARQQRDIRSQKFNLLKKQEEQRLAKKKAEDAEIEKMRLEARRKSERNAAAQEALPAEIRRNREAFLQKVERNSSLESASSSQLVPPSQGMAQSQAQKPFGQAKLSDSMFHY